MAIPIGEPVLIATVLGMLAKEGIAFGLLKKRERVNGNEKPGEAKECQSRRREIDGNSLKLEQLYKNIERKEERDDKFQERVLKELDKLNGRSK